MVLLEGQLFIHILKAKRLYNADGIFSTTKNKSDPYVKCKIGNTNIAKTKVLNLEASVWLHFIVPTTFYPFFYPG